MHLFVKGLLPLVLGAAVMTSGCATVDQVNRAQAAADSAHAQADAAFAAAQAAQARADQANSSALAAQTAARDAAASADAARADARAASQRIETTTVRRVRGERG